MKKLGKVGLRRQRNLAKLSPPEDGRCEKCGNLARLQRHHIIKRSQCGTENPENLSWLCLKCHNAAHGIKVVDSKPMFSKEV